MGCKHKSSLKSSFTDRYGKRFLWASCHLDSLKKCLSPADVKMKLRSLPMTLEETYDQILLEIDKDYELRAFKILQWLAFSARSVRVDEMAEVLAIELHEGRQRFDSDSQLFDQRDVLKMCSSLIATDVAPIQDAMDKRYCHHCVNHLVDFGDADYIRLAHGSVRDFLVSKRIRAGEASVYATGTVSANRFIAQTCLVYLMHPAFASGYGGKDITTARLKDWPLFHYAANWWPFHVKAIGHPLDDETWQLIDSFFATKDSSGGGNFGAWVSYLVPEITSRTTQPLYYAASYGITTVVEKLLASQPKPTIDARGGRLGGTALYAACYRDNNEVIKLLLEAGADPMLVNEAGESCLFWPTVRGNVEAQELLETYGATFSQQDSEMAQRLHHIEVQAPVITRISRTVDGLPE
jgi:Ankyrin repeats (3 copies)